MKIKVEVDFKEFQIDEECVTSRLEEEIVHRLADAYVKSVRGKIIKGITPESIVSEVFDRIAARTEGDL